MRWLLAKFIFIKISQIYLWKDKTNEYEHLILIWNQIYVFSYTYSKIM